LERFKDVNISIVYSGRAKKINYSILYEKKTFRIMSLFNFQLKCDLLEYDNMCVCVKGSAN